MNDLDTTIFLITTSFILITGALLIKLLINNQDKVK